VILDEGWEDRASLERRVDADSFETFRRGYVFFNPPKSDLFIHGFFYVLLSHTDRELSRAGLMKQILFPLMRQGHKYKIELLNITTNGLYLDVERNHDRSRRNLSA